jgi:hypothetical protein
MVGVAGLATGAGACEGVKVGETKVVVDEISVVGGVIPDGSTELIAVVVEVSFGPEGCNVSIEVVKVVGVRADGFVVAAFDRVLDLVLALGLKDEVAMLLLLAGTVLFRRTFVHRLPRNVVIEDIWRVPRDAWGNSWGERLE